jgi:hypothetical protein
VPPMSEPELRAAIVEPARTAGMTIVDGLVEPLLREVGLNPEPGVAHAQGVLPLLSHALRVTFDAAGPVAAGPWASDVYRSTGGLRRAIADTAETVYDELDRNARRVTRRVLLRTVHVGDTAVDARRVADREELAGWHPDVEAEEISVPRVASRRTGDRHHGR